MRGKAGGAKVSQQHDLLEKVFHGTEIYTSLLDWLMNGQHLYDSCFYHHEIQNNCKGNDLCTNGDILKLIDTFNCCIGSNFMVHERSFTKKVIETAKGSKIDGRNLDNHA
jgi:hypothetical protein